MTKEEFKQLIIDTVHELKIDYEDFIGYTFSDNINVWMNNINRIFPDTYAYSVFKEDEDRAQLVKDSYKKLLKAYCQVTN